MPQQADLVALTAATSLAPSENAMHHATDQAQKQVDLVSRLDSLPAELRSHLLHCLDLESLSALVHASPIYHAQYREDRGRVLLDSVERTAPDAFVIRLAQSQTSDFIRNLAGFFKSYSGATARTQLNRQGQIDTDVAVEMAHSYFNVVKPLADNFASLALDNLAQETSLADAIPKQSLGLTSSERTRVTRAMYRFELYGEIMRCDGYLYNRHEESDLNAFLDTMEPWEVEEFLSFYESTQLIYYKLVDRVMWDLHPENPKFDDQNRPPTPTGAFDLDERTDRKKNFVEGLILKGLSLLHTAVLGVKDHEHLVSLMQENMEFTICYLDCYSGFVGSIVQEQLYGWGAKRGKLMDDQTRMPFQGDDRIDTPPLAWTILWREVYSSLYGEFIPGALRRWGFVFWDASRLKSTGAIEVLQREMEDWQDPRHYDAPYEWASAYYQSPWSEE